MILTSCNLSNVIIYSKIIFYWLINFLSFVHNILVFCFYFEKKYHVGFVQCVLSSNEEKAYLLLENLDQLSNQNMGFAPVLLILNFVPVNCFYKTWA